MGQGRGQDDDRERAVTVVADVVGRGSQLAVGEQGIIRQSPAWPIAWAAMNGTQVALPENQVVVPVISRTASSARSRSIACMSDCSNAVM